MEEDCPADAVEMHKGDSLQIDPAYGGSRGSIQNASLQMLL